MQYKLMRFYNGNIELILLNKNILLNDLCSTCILTEDEYIEFVDKYESLILTNLIKIKKIEPQIKTDKNVKQIKK